MKIFYGLVALACAFLLFDSVQTGYARYVAGKADDAYIQTSPDADLDVVEFLDYSCSACRTLHPIVKRAIERDGRVRHVIKPIIPIDGNDIGTQTGVLALAAGRQDKFFEAHEMLIENYRNINETYIENFAQTLGLDETQLRNDMNDPDIRKELVKNSNTLNRLKSKTVPSLLLNGRLMYSIGMGNPSSDYLQNLFNAARGL